MAKVVRLDPPARFRADERHTRSDRILLASEVSTEQGVYLTLAEYCIVGGHTFLRNPRPLKPLASHNSLPTGVSARYRRIPYVSRTVFPDSNHHQELSNQISGGAL